MHQRTTEPTIRCASSEDMPAHPRSLLRVVADRMCFLQSPGYPKRDEQEPLPCWMDVQAFMSLCWSHRSYCRFYRVLVQMSSILICWIFPDRDKGYIVIVMSRFIYKQWRLFDFALNNLIQFCIKRHKQRVYVMNLFEQIISEKDIWIYVTLQIYRCVYIFDTPYWVLL